MYAHDGPSLDPTPSRPDEKALSSQEYFLRNCNKSGLTRARGVSAPRGRSMETNRFRIVVELHHQLLHIVVSLLEPCRMSDPV